MVEDRAMSRAIIVYASLIVATLAVVALAAFRPIRVLPRIAPAPGYALTDQDGQRFTSEEMRGTVTLYDFRPVSSCNGPCDATTDVMRTIQDELAVLGVEDPPVKLVTISLDPEHDTPEVLRTKAAELGADTNRWRFATGSADLVKMVVGGGFDVFYDNQDDGSVRYDPAMVLVDGWGIIRAEYRVGVPNPEHVLKDIQSVTNEAQKSRGPARLAYEATHLFVCYTR